VQPQRFLSWGSLPAAIVPRVWAEWLADAAGDWAHRGAPSARRTVARNLTAVLGTPPAAATVRGVFRTYARYYLGMMRLRHRAAGAAVGDLEWNGCEALQASRSNGRGVLVLSAHLGNWDVVGVALAQRFGRTTIFVEALQPESVARFYTKTRARHGVAIAPVGSPGRAPIETLRRGGMVALAADRPFGRRMARVDCGTGSIDVPLGGIALALRAGAAIHPVFAIRTASGWRLVCGADLTAGLDPKHPETAMQVAARFALALHAQVQRVPDQWCMLQPLAPRGAA
jgi:KDO2-lipid IV(A) lauroyltransferase